MLKVKNIQQPMNQYLNQFAPQYFTSKSKHTWIVYLLGNVFESDLEITWEREKWTHVSVFKCSWVTERCSTVSGLD